MFEKKIINYPEYVNIRETEQILEQMKRSICKINKGTKERGSGFFCYIPNNNKKIKVLITNYHVIDDKYIKDNGKINLEINNGQIYKNILLEDDRKIYLSEINQDDLAIIEIKDKDDLNEINF